MVQKPSFSSAEIAQNVIIGLTVSFVALSLGAALGILSGRGAFAGMISAGIIAFITSVLGGTRVQCSGPTAPMSAVSALVVAFAVSGALDSFTGLKSDHFINIVFMLSGGLILLMGVLRLGRFIALVPNIVISGFMNGIAVLIWVGQVCVLFGLGGKTALTGEIWLNLAVTAATLGIIFAAPGFLRQFHPALARFLPSTLIAIITVTAFVATMEIEVEKVSIDATIGSVAEFTELIATQWPLDWSFNVLWLALPFALQLSVLGYLDTLLTSRVIDRMVGETTRANKELIAQGVANSTVALIGGIPGAQATIRSVLMVKEGATLRIAGICVGGFVIIEMLMFQHLISFIPQAVFTGVLIKVGYDVFDFQPLQIYFRSLRGKKPAHHLHDVSHVEIMLITGVTLVTVLYDLNAAVIGFTLLIYLLNRFVFASNPIQDLITDVETEGVRDQP